MRFPKNKKLFKKPIFCYLMPSNKRLFDQYLTVLRRNGCRCCAGSIAYSTDCALIVFLRNSGFYKDVGRIS